MMKNQIRKGMFSTPEAIMHKSSVKIITDTESRNHSTYGTCDFCGREIACNRVKSYSVGHKTPHGWRPGIMGRIRIWLGMVEIL